MLLEEENAKLTVAAVSQRTYGGKGWGWKKTREDGMPPVCAERIGRIVEVQVKGKPLPFLRIFVKIPCTNSKWQAKMQGQKLSNAFQNDVCCTYMLHDNTWHHFCAMYLRRRGAPKPSDRRLVHKQRTHFWPGLLEGNSYEKTRKNYIMICMLIHSSIWMW